MSMSAFDLHTHQWGEVETSRFTGNVHRKCKVEGCNHVTLDIEEDTPLIRGTDEDDTGEFTLGSCGCTDYHPTRSPQIDDYEDDPYDNERW